jgi:hypothetical protein
MNYLLRFIYYFPCILIGVILMIISDLIDLFLEIMACIYWISIDLERQILSILSNKYTQYKKEISEYCDFIINNCK